MNRAGNQQRRIIQITGTTNTQNASLVCALCDDGSVWEGTWEERVWHWYRLPDVPQTTEEDEVA